MPTTEREVRMIDIANADLVEIEVSPNGQKIWVNVDGLCRLRINGRYQLSVKDERKSK